MILVDNVSKYYGEHAAVRDLSFSIKAGEVVGLLGLNGAGKTTTLKMLSGALLPTSGKINVAGVDMAQDADSVRARIGFLPETPPLYPEMRVRDFLEFVAHIKGMRGRLDGALDEALAVTDLTQVQEQFIGTLSHGFQRRVGIAQALVHKPTLILLDEPTSGLDPVQVVHMRKLVRDLKSHHTVLVSSHILSEIQQVCDRILVIQAGRLAAEGTEAELARRVAHTTTVHVEVRGAAAALSSALASSSAVTRHTIDAESDGVTTATVELSSDVREDLARVLVQAGLGLRRLERVRLELENIFMKLTGSENNDMEARS